GSNARVLAREEWNKARAVATTSEIFKAMSRTGAGGDAYFALVALFCTADKLVVPVHCQESPITVEFVNRPSSGSGGGGGTGGRSSHWPGRAWAARNGAGGGAGTGGSDDVHVLVTVPSTFDIYLRDGAATSGSGSNGLGGSSSSSGSISNSSGHRRRSGGGGGGGGGNTMHRKGSGGSTLSKSSAGSGAAGTDASMALHLVRVKAVVVEEIWVVGSGGRKSPLGASAGNRPVAADDTPPTLRF
ncbi:unnamed protein product, partial [Hapterophycus canaliculatus]